MKVLFSQKMLHMRPVIHMSLYKHSRRAWDEASYWVNVPRTGIIKQKKSQKKKTFSSVIPVTIIPCGMTKNVHRCLVLNEDDRTCGTSNFPPFVNIISHLHIKRFRLIMLSFISVLLITKQINIFFFGFIILFISQEVLRYI